MNMLTSHASGKRVTFTHLDKVMYPDTNFTKGDLIDYYRDIAPFLLPHIKDTAVTLKRYPNGVESKFFFTKRCPSYKPSWMKTCRMSAETAAEPVNYCVLDSEEALLWAANQASIELHALLFNRSNTDRPRVMVFDLDPGPPATMLDCIELAQSMREVLDAVGLQSFPKVSGGKGLHLYVPLNSPVTFQATRRFAKTLAQKMEKKHPDLAISNMKKELRSGRVLVDWSQNHQHKTTVAVYSLRARSRPTVSMPVAWDELAAAARTRDAAALVFEASRAVREARRRSDLFTPVLTLRQKLPPPVSLGLS